MMRGNYVHYVVQNGSSFTLHDYMDFLWCTGKEAEEIWDKDHIFGGYLEKCTWEDMQSLRYPCFLTS